MNILNNILNSLFPKKCIGCGKVLNEEKERFFCDDCKKDAVFLTFENSCPICSAPIDAKDRLCVNCQTHKRSFTKNISCAKYSGSIKKAVLRFKFSGKKEICRDFSQIIYEELIKQVNLPSFDILAAVPIHKKRLKERGFDQCNLMARLLADKLGISYADRELVKIKNNPPQSSIKNPAERMKNVAGAFAVTDKTAFSGKTVLLLDDVFTSGATLSEVSRILLKSGAKEVYSVTVAMATGKTPDD